MEEKTKIKTSLTDLTGNSENDSGSLSQSGKTPPPPSNLPREGSQPIPVPIVNSSTTDDNASDENKLDKVKPAEKITAEEAPEIKMENPEEEKAEEKSDSQDENQPKPKPESEKTEAEKTGENTAKGPLDFDFLEPGSPTKEKEGDKIDNPEAESKPEIENESNTTSELKSEVSESLEEEFSKVNQEQNNLEQKPVMTTEETAQEPATIKEEESQTVKISNLPSNGSEDSKKAPEEEKQPVVKNAPQENFLNKGLKDIRGKDDNNPPPPTKNNAKPKFKAAILLPIIIFVFLAIGVGIYYYFGFFNQENDSTAEDEFMEMEIKPVGQEDSSTGTGATYPTDSQFGTGNVGAEKENQLKLSAESKEIEITALENLNTKIEELKLSEVIGGNLIQLIPVLEEEITLAQLQEALGIIIPEEIATGDTLFSLLALKEGEITKTSLVLATTNPPETVKSQMLNWEQTIVGDLKPLLLGEVAEDPANPEDFRFRNSSKFPNGRFINLSQSKNLSIDYSILADKILISTSYSMLEELVKIAEETEE